MPCSKPSLLPCKTEQPRTHYVYAYSNDIHTFATNVLLTQQLFKVLFFLVKFKTFGLTVELGLATKIRAKALEKTEAFFEILRPQKVLGQEVDTR